MFPERGEGREGGGGRRDEMGKVGLKACETGEGKGTEEEKEAGRKKSRNRQSSSLVYPQGGCS